MNSYSCTRRPCTRRRRDVSEGTNLSMLDGIGIGLADAHVEPLYQLLRRTTSLRELRLSRNRYRDAGMRCIVRGMVFNESVEKIWLGGRSDGQTKLEWDGRRGVVRRSSEEEEA